uniref:Uncharacterized protein n=1 Tax=Siphoviridae sp. ctFIm6 TaxID=2827818 RepID=A0A8S5SJQ4_9CAUD|nr:MAG TPA: hypothetical protein [Siphoviridae sp. ctFIm6]
MRGASCGDPCTLPRGQKSFDPASADRMPPFTQKIFPTGKCGRGCCGADPAVAGMQRDWTGCSTGRSPGRDPHDKRVRIGHRPPGGVEGLRTYAGY